MSGGLAAVVVDPLIEAVPPAWDEFVAAQRLAPFWRADLLRVADRCARVPSSMVLVLDAGEPVALFHVRHLRLADPRRFPEPRRTRAPGIAECRVFPRAAGTGMAYAAELPPAERLAAVRVFERAVARPFIAYRDLPPAALPLIPAARRLRLRLSPSMVIQNEWSDLDAYLGHLPKKWRNQLRQARRGVAAETTLDEGHIIDGVRASWLADLVVRRHVSLPAPPVPPGYLATLAAQPGVSCVQYRSAQGHVVAFALLYDDGTELTPVFWGSDGRAGIYFDLWLRLVEAMIRAGRERLVMGKGLAALKARFGARPEPLWGLVGRP